MMRAILVILAGLLVGGMCETAHAETGPSTRRVLLACIIEDPSCAPMFVQALDAFKANPKVGACYSQASHTDPVKCPSGGGWTEWKCYYQGKKLPSIDLIFARFMSLERQDTWTWPGAARIGIYDTMNSFGLCAP